MCISTGTGSTSWTFNISKMTKQSVQAVLKILSEISHERKSNQPIPNIEDLDILSEEVTQRFNEDIVFDPEEQKMAYTLRDPVQIGPFFDE